MDNNDSRLTYLSEVASMYYDQNMNQQEIADKVGITRSAISRLLTEARAKGIVEIIVHYPWRTVPELEQKLRAAFNLKEVRVLMRGNKSYDQMLEGLGVLAAQYFSGILQPKDVVGISWGTGLHEMLRALRPKSYPEVDVVQLVGGTGTEKVSAVGPLLAPMLANTLGATCHYLHAPLITESEAAHKALCQERSIRETLARGEQSRIALVGVGSTAPEVYNPYRMGYVNECEMSEIRAAGAVGTVCGRLYALDGSLPDISINRRVVGIEPEALVKIEVVIGVSGGAVKAEAILGALRGRHINVLITDELAAQKVLDLAQS